MHSFCRVKMQFRTVLDVKVVDVEKRRNPSKHYVYLINVTYSDNTSHIIYRRYSKFFDLQALVRLPPQISQSDEVLRFFETKAEDVNPPVEDYGSKRKSVWMYGFTESPRKEASGLEALEPMVLEQYVAVANYERQENSEISLKAGETVDVIEKSESGWWFVSTAEQQGWVPATYLDSQNGTRDDLELGTSRTGEVTKRRKSHLKRLDRRWTLGGIVNRQQSREEKYVTVQSYASQGKDEVSFEKGVTVEVIQKNLEGWWYIRHQGTEGWAPASYLKKLKEDFSSRKKTLTGPVEIIGNIMEISSLLQKKSVSEKDIQTDAEVGADAAERHLSKSEISLPVPYSSEINAETGRRLSAGRDTNSPCLGLIAASSVAHHAGAPAVARVAPHRVEIGSPNLRQKPPPRRESHLGLHLPKPPEPPAVEAEYYTIADFQSSISDGISFRGGQKADVIEKNPGGWWYVQIGEKEGWAPCSYIDKRKKPNVNRRSSTLTRPKVPPPAPPVKRQDAEEPPAAKGSEPAPRAAYEEPQYDVPAAGCDGESDSECVKEAGGSSATIQYQQSPPASKAGPASCQASPVFGRRRTSYRSVEEVSKAESVYENEGFRASGAAAKGSSEPSSPRSYRSSTVPRKPSGSSPLAGRPIKTVTPDMTRRSQTLGRQLDGGLRSQDDSLRSSSFKASALGRSVEHRIGQSPCSRPKPSVRPKPLLTKSEPHSPERSEAGSLRRQLKPAAQFRHGLKPSCGEPASVGSACSRSTSDLPSVYAQGSRAHTLYRSVDAYQKVQDSEISFPAGVEVEVLEKQESGWWYVRRGAEEGWAPSYYLEASSTVGDGGRSECGRASDGLEKHLQQQPARQRNSPPIPSKPPGGFSKPSGLANGGVRMRNGVRQVAVRPQSVFVTATQPAKESAHLTGSLRRSDSRGRSHHYSSGSATLGVRRNASFSTVRPHVVVESQRPADRSALTSAAGQRNGASVSTVRPKAAETKQPSRGGLGRELYVSIADYHGDEETMGFTEGTCLEVLERNPNGWWYCQVQDCLLPRKGWVPSNYLERKK
ncbi:SH3 and PX domain-containing protein 2A-like isoform X2 [Synchiropus splendidus]|uniref:SH3 and PX domain-containing protein 2A-like isoform X2 n=1 Tax=Synchiropus splendidus TaxID=270530 RepID=UPI00237DB7FF|nr:SH3 and PX domain-containing protein 2A-like isoform X2 [Synchiropus splendidus]